MANNVVKARAKVFCANPGCNRREMNVVKNGVKILETSLGGTQAYKLWQSDILACKSCGAEIARTSDSYMANPDMSGQGLRDDDLLCVEFDFEIDPAEMLFRERKRSWIASFETVCKNFSQDDYPLSVFINKRSGKFFVVVASLGSVEGDKFDVSSFDTLEDASMVSTLLASLVRRKDENHVAPDQD